MNRQRLFALALLAPLLLLVRTIVRAHEDEQRMERLFGTPAEQQAAADRILQNAANDLDAGAAAGAQETEAGCLREGFAREHQGPRQYAQLMHFLEGCLGAAQPSPGFCDEVPPYRATMSPDDEARSHAWQRTTCAKEGLDDRDCRANIRVVQLHCHPLR